MSMSSRSLVQMIFAFLAVGAAALLAIVIMTLWLGERAQFFFEDAIAARDTRVAAVELRNALLTAESSQRGFVITGNEIYLAPYQSAKTQAKRHFAALKVLLPSKTGPDAALERLSVILDTKFGELDHTIDLKRNQRDEDVSAIFRANTGKALTDEANVFFAGIIGKADDRLTMEVAEQRANAGMLRLVSAIGALVIIVVVGGAVYAIAGYMKELRATRDQVHSLNADLERRVDRRTTELAGARDRAEMLLSEVNHRVANSLALVSSLVSIQSKALNDQASKEALAETQDRILAISLVHKRLYASGDVRSVALNEYLTGLLDQLRSSMRSKGWGVDLSFDIEPMDLDTDASINLGVVVTELVTNAFKYAYPDGAGEIRVVLRKTSDEKAELLVEDDGIGREHGAPAKGTGVGTRIVNAMCMNLGGRIDYSERSPGTAARLLFAPKRMVA